MRFADLNVLILIIPSRPNRNLFVYKSLLHRICELTLYGFYILNTIITKSSLRNAQNESDVFIKIAILTVNFHTIDRRMLRVFLIRSLQIIESKKRMYLKQRSTLVIHISI